MRNALAVLWLLLCPLGSADAQVSVAIGLPDVNIGINLPAYPELVPVPGYPVYYAPRLNSNYFFYDGMYWVYQRDNWYASSWYNGPWGLVTPEAVPAFVLRVPVRYYRRPPAYFRGWIADAPPRWGEHWGNSWEQDRHGWDTWNRSAVPLPAPLPAYQRQYSGNRYPRVDQQPVIQGQNYRYQPHDAVVQERYRTQQVQAAPATPSQARPGTPQQRISASPERPGYDRSTAVPQSAPTPARPQPAPNAVAAAPKPVTSQGPAPQERVSTAHDSRRPSPPSSVQTAGAPASRGQVPETSGGRAREPAMAQVSSNAGKASVEHPKQPAVPPPAVHEQQPPKAQGKDSSPEAKHGQEKTGDGGEQHGGDRNK